MDEGTYLTALERAHRDRTGTFCYIAVQRSFDRLWALSIVERYVDGHFPVSEDWFLGTESQMKREALRLNSDRLGVSPSEAVEIICTSMVASRRA